MISEAEAARAEQWIARGGGRRAPGSSPAARARGAVLEPTILTGVGRDMRVVCEEIFAPVVSVIPFDTLDEAIDAGQCHRRSASPPASSRATSPRAFTAARRLHVGVVHINESSSSRVDLMPFGGVKDSGLGREGPKYAMHEMTEERLITISL